MEGYREPFQFRLTSAQVTAGAFVVTIAGELDLHNARRIDAELDELVDGGAEHVVVDLLEVPFLESTVLGVLVRQAGRLRRRGGELTIVTDDARVLRVFEVTGLGSHFRFRRSLADAVEVLLAEAIR